MSAKGAIELRDIRLAATIGTFGPGETVPEGHWLDLTLSVSPALILTAADGMAGVFDYDPLLAEIDRLARDGAYETQERLLTRIVLACAAYPAIGALEIALRKAPAPGGSGSVGVRLALDAAALDALR
jgi:dihydroneopterin aldolase